MRGPTNEAYGYDSDFFTRSGTNGECRRRTPVNSMIARRRNQRCCHLCCSGRMVVGLDQLDVHLGHIFHSWKGIVVEVRLFDYSVLDRYALAERQTETIHNAAFGLSNDIIGLHRDAAVDGTPEIMHFDLSDTSAIPATWLPE